MWWASLAATCLSLSPLISLPECDRTALPFQKCSYLLPSRVSPSAGRQDEQEDLALASPPGTAYGYSG